MIYSMKKMAGTRQRWMSTSCAKLCVPSAAVPLRSRPLPSVACLRCWTSSKPRLRRHAVAPQRRMEYHAVFEHYSQQFLNVVFCNFYTYRLEIFNHFPSYFLRWIMLCKKRLLLSRTSLGNIQINMRVSSRLCVRTLTLLMSLKQGIS